MTCLLNNLDRVETAMSQSTKTVLIDDLDGSEAAATVRFGLDGAHYEIDLNAVHAKELREALARYTAAGRKVAAAARRPARGGIKAAASKFDSTEIRHWARENGLDVKERGRVPADLVARYRAATGQ
jgi:hypothetical protein